MPSAVTYEVMVEPHLAKVTQWAKLGLPDKRIAQKLGVSARSLTRWKKEHAALLSALKKGRQDLCDELQSALIKRALGYDYEESEEKTDTDGKVTTVTKKKHEPANVAALTIALRNFSPGWSDNPEASGIKHAELELKRQATEGGQWHALV